MIRNKVDTMNDQKEISFNDIFRSANTWATYLLSKWLVLLISAILFGAAGIFYAWLQKPVYTSELTFVSENESSSAIGGYAGIAAQFGLDLSNKGSAFEGDNLMQIMHSRRVIEKTLFTPVLINNTEQLLINYWIDVTKMRKGWEKEDKYKDVVFTTATKPYSRIRDSVLKAICEEVGKDLEIGEVEKKSDVTTVKMKSSDELFAKVFVEKLMTNVISYYTEYKIGKTKQNVSIIQKQTDSVRNLISGNIVDIALSNDLNVNPTRQIVRTGVQRKQVDAQVNGALYTELVKNLELSKITLRKETPLVHIIDTPMLPLEKKKMGRLKGAILFAFAGFFLTVICLVFAKVLAGAKA